MALIIAHVLPALVVPQTADLAVAGRQGPCGRFGIPGQSELLRRARFVSYSSVY